MRVRESTGKGSMRTVASIACLICAVAAFGLCFRTNVDVSMFGFPDGYITDYQKAAEGPLRVIAWVQAGFGLLFLALAFSPISSRRRTIACLAALIGLVLVAIAAQTGIPWYFGTYLGLDNGIGG